MSSDWLGRRVAIIKRQKEYDDLVAYFGGAPRDRTGPEAFALHQRVVRILDGKEPDPRVLSSLPGDEAGHG